MNMAAQAQYWEQVGYNALVARLGAANTPNGSGVRVAIVEANEAGNTGFRYAPDPSLNPDRPGFSITQHSGTGTGYSGHAGGVAGVFFGNTSMATGITNVDSYEANHWILSGQLQYNTTNLPLISNPIAKISNHSYTGTTGNISNDENILQRADYFIERTGQIMVVGVGGNTSGSVSTVFGSALNAITVGRTMGAHGSGLTEINIPGRVRPDLVAPQESVSNATPVVSAAAALLVQTGGVNSAATAPITIKAVLMAGATKAEFGTNWTRTETRPLDLVYGAGELNINNSHMILSAGQRQGGTNVDAGLVGWDKSSLSTTGDPVSRRYEFTIPESGTLGTTSAVVTWNRQFAEESLLGTLANIDLKLVQLDSSGEIVGLPLDASRSTVDNVEHIWRETPLPTGRYAWLVELNSIGNTDYALAWQTFYTPVPEPTWLLFLAPIMAGFLNRGTTPSDKQGKKFVL